MFWSITVGFPLSAPLSSSTLPCACNISAEFCSCCFGPQNQFCANLTLTNQGFNSDLILDNVLLGSSLYQDDYIYMGECFSEEIGGLCFTPLAGNPFCGTFSLSATPFPLKEIYQQNFSFAMSTSCNSYDIVPDDLPSRKEMEADYCTKNCNLPSGGCNCSSVDCFCCSPQVDGGCFMLNYMVSPRIGVAVFVTYMEYQNYGFLTGVSVFNNTDKLHMQEYCTISLPDPSGVTACMAIQQTSPSTYPFTGAVVFRTAGTKPVSVGPLSLK